MCGQNMRIGAVEMMLENISQTQRHRRGSHHRNDDMPVAAAVQDDEVSVVCEPNRRQARSMDIRTDPIADLDPMALLDTAFRQAQLGLAEGGIPIGAALFRADGKLLGEGRNRRIQHDDPSVHGETDAFRAAGRQRDYSSTVMVTTLAPCWYCSGLIRQFGIGAVIIGENRTFSGGQDWLADLGVAVTIVDDSRCVAMMTDFIAAHPAVWNEDIGVADTPIVKSAGGRA